MASGMPVTLSDAYQDNRPRKDISSSRELAAGTIAADYEVDISSHVISQSIDN